MPVSADVLRTHLDYTAWASARLVEAAAALPPEQLTHDFQTADKSVLGTLVHVFGADRIWLARVKGVTPGPYLTDADYHLSVLQTTWPEVLGEWRWRAAGWTDETVTTAISYTDMRGNQWTQPLWQLILHVVNHGTHHRGQASGFLRALGHKPPVLDLVAFYRHQAAHA
jgi:uncharacterized damage-inducible protein DinB